MIIQYLHDMDAPDDFGAPHRLDPGKLLPAPPLGGENTGCKLRGEGRRGAHCVARLRGRLCYLRRRRIAPDERSKADADNGDPNVTH
jgi:hypothetical protein